MLANATTVSKRIPLTRTHAYQFVLRNVRTDSAQALKTALATRDLLETITTSTFATPSVLRAARKMSAHFGLIARKPRHL